MYRICHRVEGAKCKARKDLTEKEKPNSLKKGLLILLVKLGKAEDAFPVSMAEKRKAKLDHRSISKANH